MQQADQMDPRTAAAMRRNKEMTMQQADQMEPRTAAAVAEAVRNINARWQDQVAGMKNDLALRRWCVERATSVSTPDVVKLATDLHSFVSGAFDAGPPPAS